MHAQRCLGRQPLLRPGIVNQPYDMNLTTTRCCSLGPSLNASPRIPQQAPFWSSATPISRPILTVLAPVLRSPASVPPALRTWPQAWNPAGLGPFPQAPAAEGPGGRPWPPGFGPGPQALARAPGPAGPCKIGLSTSFGSPVEKKKIPTNN